MASAPLTLTLEEVKDFLLANNGRVKNSALVLHFKHHFNDPVAKNANKEKFKEIVNKLAVVKTEAGEKLIVLKKKYRPDGRPMPSLDSVSSFDSVTSAALNLESESEKSSGSMPSSREQSMEPLSDPSSREPSQSRDLTLNYSVKSADETGYEADASRESSIAPEEASIQDISPIVSVKDRAKVLNKMSEKPPEPKDYRMIGKIGKTQKMLAEEERLQTVSLIDPVEHEWMIVSAKCDYLRMAKMLQEHEELARRKDYTNGYSGLHWACKHENMDAVKLLAGSYACPVNARSHGGYTALHLAAMQGNYDMMDLLIKTYGADSEIRDFNGRKPKQYLQNAGKRKHNFVKGPTTAIDTKRMSKITAEEVDAAMKRAGAESSHQGIGSFLNPQLSSLRASFRINKPMKRDGNVSPTMMRRSHTTKFSSGSESSDKESVRNRPISVPVGVTGIPKSQSDTEIMTLNQAPGYKGSLV